MWVWVCFGGGGGYLGTSDLIKALDGRSSLVGAWVALGCHDDGEGNLGCPVHGHIRQFARAGCQQHLQEVRLEPHHQALALGIPKAHIVLQKLGLCQYEDL